MHLFYFALIIVNLVHLSSRNATRFVHPRKQFYFMVFFSLLFLQVRDHIDYWNIISSIKGIVQISYRHNNAIKFDYFLDYPRSSNSDVYVCLLLRCCFNLLLNSVIHLRCSVGSNCSLYI